MINKIIKLREKYSYAFNLILVLVLVEVNRIMDLSVWMPEQPHKTKFVLFDTLFEFISIIPFVFLIIYCYERLINRKNKVYFILGITVFTCIGPTLALLLNTLLTFTFFRNISLPFTFGLAVRYTPIGTTIFLLLSATYYITHLRLQSTKQIEAIHRAENLTKEVQVKMLRYQINPHFLFNVLNSIHALIDENKEKAKRLVVEMSEYYRYTLNKLQQTIPIVDEIEAVTKYLDIQKMRFEDELLYTVHVDDNARMLPIPPFVIHLLIENAVKFGNCSANQRLEIEISIKLIDKSLKILVSNTGRLLQKSNSNRVGDGTGSGIENIKSRLALMYNCEYSFSLTEENGWVTANIVINNITG